MRFRISADRARNEERINRSKERQAQARSDRRRGDRRHGTCPVCRDDRYLDFHHWIYGEDMGVEICRECHKYIHKPHGARPSESVGNEWWDIAIRRLLVLHFEHSSWIKNPDTIIKRYNIPRSYRANLENRVKIRTSNTGKVDS